MKKQGQLSNQIKKLQYQLSYSQHINKELSAQLSALCDKMGIAPNKFKQTSDINLINTQKHLQELYYVQPLLMCYQETIYLLKSELDQVKEQAKSISQNVDKIVNENTFIRKQLQSKIQLLTKADNLGINVNFLTLENKDLKDKIGIINAKNEFLVRKNKQLNDDYQKLKSQNLSLFGQSELDKLQHKAKQQSKLKQTQLIKIKSQIEILKNQLNNQKSIVADLQRKVAQQDNEIIKLKNQLKVTKQQLENSQTISDRVRQNLQSQLVTIKDQLSISQKKQQQMFTKSMTLESELQDKSNKIHNVNVQNSQLQSNNNNMLQMLESYQVKVSSLTKKIKKLETEIKQMSEQKSENVKRAEISQWKLAQKNEQLERKQAEWRKQKARITKMWQDRLEAVRKNYDVQTVAPTNIKA